jgi:putative RNA 2'-phosphotransferase
MMDPRQLTRISRYLARHLRHEPQRIGLTLLPGGWVPVDDLLDACRAHQFALTREELEAVVAQNDKQRFAFDETGTHIRANQGHSVEVDLQLEAVQPPTVLFHGTSQRVSAAIEQMGILKMSRHHVHLSEDIETVLRVGARHGVPVVFRVDAARMAADGHRFFRSANGVWLTDHVPALYVARHET